MPGVGARRVGKVMSSWGLIRDLARHEWVGSDGAAGRPAPPLGATRLGELLAGREVQGEQLAALDEFAGERVVGLHIEELPAFAEERGRDHPRCLLFFGEDPGRTGTEPVRVVLGDLG